MLRYKLLYKTALLFTMVLCISCEIVSDLDEVDPGFVIPQSQAVTDRASAELLVIGVYTSLKSDRQYTFIPQQTAFAGLSGEPFNFSFFVNDIEVFQNNPSVDNVRVEAIYTGLYGNIQQVNLAIETLEPIGDDIVSAADKAGFIAELRFIRANSHLYLLRHYGEFYDLSSEYGISIRTKAANSSSFATPRSTVQESYDIILEDLDFAINNLQDRGVSYRASVEAAEAIKAKVMLYMGKYEEARDMLATLIASTSKTFANDLNQFFIKPHTFSEVLFAPFNDFPEDNISIYRPVRVGASVYATVGSGDPRESVVKGFGQFDNGDPLNFSPPFFRTQHIFMRLAEVYLMHAEASARANGGVDATALASLNAVRTRAAVGLPALQSNTDINSNQELLEAIRTEKLLELRHENGEDLIDIIRYHIEGDLVASTIKPTLNNVDKFIWPIPLDEIVLARDQAGVEIVQNPGYE